MQHVMSMMKKELMTGRMEEEMALRIFWRERSRPNMRMACAGRLGGADGGRGWDIVRGGLYTSS
jgi:hypothetical protein